MNEERISRINEFSVKADRSAEQFFDALRDVFVGAKVEGESRSAARPRSSPDTR